MREELLKFMTIYPNAEIVNVQIRPHDEECDEETGDITWVGEVRHFHKGDAFMIDDPVSGDPRDTFLAVNCNDEIFDTDYLEQVHVCKFEMIAIIGWVQ